MEIITTTSSDDERFDAANSRSSKSRRKIGGTMPRASSVPVVHGFGSSSSYSVDDQRLYATPPIEEQQHQQQQPRGGNQQEVRNYPPSTTLASAKRILLTSQNRTEKLSVTWAVLIIGIFLSSALLFLGAYHVIQAYRDVEDAPNTLLSQSVAAAPAPAVSLYYEAVSILQLGLITLFAGGLGVAAYFPHDVRRPAKMAFLIFVALSVHIALNQIASIGEDVAHKINLDIPNDAYYRLAELCALPAIVVCLLIACYPACAAFVLYKFEKQTNRCLRILYLIINVAAMLVFAAYAAASSLAMYRGYYGERQRLSRIGPAARLSFAVCTLPASIMGILITIGTLKPIASGSRSIGVWCGILSAAGLLVMYDGTPLLAGLFQDVKGDAYDSVYLIQCVLHACGVLVWTGVILVSAAFAYLR